MSFELPSLSLKINKEFKNENKNENINNINNTIIINKDAKDSTTELKGVLPEIIEKSQTPEIIKIFKEYLLLTLIDYFKNDIILLNNLLEISKYIVFKEEDIIKLISILVTDGDVFRIKIDYELPDQFKICSCCTKLPVYRKITSIIIDNKKIASRLNTNRSMFKCRLNLIFHWIIFLFKGYIKNGIPRRICGFNKRDY
jgi:hypothetical protein